MSDFYNAPREIYGVPKIMNAIKEIKSFEEDRYSEVPKWDGFVVNWTDGAVLLSFTQIERPARENWFPYSTLRKTEDGLTVYASNWILEKKGF